MSKKSNYSGNRKRNLNDVGLSEEALNDIKALRKIRKELERLDARMVELRSTRREIWRRRGKVDDVWHSELAEISGVTKAYVAREIGG